MIKSGITIAAVCLAASVFAQVDPERVVVKVNGAEVKGQEYYRRMEFLPGVGKRVGQSMMEFPPGFLTLEQLITERLVLQLAREKGVSPTQPEIDAEFNVRMSEDPELLNNWMASGKTKDELEYQIKLNVAEFKLRTAGVTVTDQEVSDFYKANPTMFTIPKRYKLRVIVVGTEDEKKAVDTDLAAGKAFADVAKERSQDITKNVGGDFGKVPANQIPEGAVRDTITATKIGETTSWIQYQSVWGKYLLESIEPEQVEALTTALRRSIRRQMMLQAGSAKNSLSKDMADLRKRSSIEISEKSFASAYQRFVDTYLKAQSTKGN